ncbi:uncharacterized protein LOC110635698 [Hevea brasiliensis]|uniref:uncharacterized protein LOC110635698 n=1 Tax=Hevea brasiliensis TaxID=3981 RepID=UPI0025F1FD6A|nr:uncharacterized protein LOC110635698 [Hevea brasiliensis]
MLISLSCFELLRDIMQMFGVLQSATMVILLSQSFMTNPCVTGIRLKNHFSLTRRRKKGWKKCLRLTMTIHLKTDMHSRTNAQRRELWPWQERATQETLTATDLIIDALDAA